VILLAVSQVSENFKLDKPAGIGITHMVYDGVCREIDKI